MKSSGLSGSFARLRRLAGAAPGRSEASSAGCDLCGQDLEPAHGHVADVETHGVLCACRACSILFERDGASAGRYRRVPNRRLWLDGFTIDAARWESLRIPVGMAFIVTRLAEGHVIACYPSPMGPTESVLEPSAWEALKAGAPRLEAMEADVEALLVNRVLGADQYFLAPIDDCYRLVGLVRAHWKGLGGGPAVAEETRRFFEELQSRSVRVPVASAEPMSTVQDDPGGGA